MLAFIEASVSSGRDVFSCLKTLIDSNIVDTTATAANIFGFLVINEAPPVKAAAFVNPVTPASAALPSRAPRCFVTKSFTNGAIV